MMTRPFTFDLVPAAMRSERRWVCWAYEFRKGKKTKVPYQPTGRHAKSTDPTTWSTFAEAVAGVRRLNLSGVGFCLGDGWVGVDIDHAVTDGRLSAKAAAVCERLESYAELSPSQEGVHVILRGEMPGGGRKCDDIEMYGPGRYFTVTGWRIDGHGCGAEAVEPADLPGFYRDTFPAKIVERPNSAVATPRHGLLVPGGTDWRRDGSGGRLNHDGPPSHLPDDQLVQAIQASRSGAKFWSLWTGNWQAYYGSASEADLALCGMLSWWCGGDMARVDSLFRQSGLMREKWTAKRGECTYGERTIRMVSEGRK